MEPVHKKKTCFVVAIYSNPSTSLPHLHQISACISQSINTLYLRYTVAYGKDVGGTEEEYGRLKSYCGMWINGGYIPLEHAYQQTRVEPTETEDGYVEYCCNNCGHTYREVIPHSGTDAQLVVMIEDRCGNHGCEGRIRILCSDRLLLIRISLHQLVHTGDGAEGSHLPGSQILHRINTAHICLSPIWHTERDYTTQI